MKPTTRLHLLLTSLAERVELVESELRRLTPPLHATLVAVAACGRRRGIAGVARSTGFSHGTAREFVSTLEDMGFCHRIARQHQFTNFHGVLVTRAGARALVEYEDLEAAVAERAFEMMDASEREALLALLDKVSVTQPSSRPSRAS